LHTFTGFPPFSMKIVKEVNFLPLDTILDKDPPPVFVITAV
jgi:hypothetical protein